jgi:hypothetical protein
MKVTNISVLTNCPEGFAVLIIPNRGALELVRPNRYTKINKNRLNMATQRSTNRSHNYHTPKPYWTTSNTQTIPWMFNPCSGLLQPIERSKPSLPPSQSIDNYRLFRASCGVVNLWWVNECVNHWMKMKARHVIQKITSVIASQMHANICFGATVITLSFSSSCD